jgi:hypothetical protein
VKAPNTLRSRQRRSSSNRRLDRTKGKTTRTQGYNCIEGGEDIITDTSASERVNQKIIWFTPCSGRFGRSGTSEKPAIRADVAIDFDDDEPYRYDRLRTAEHPLVFSLVAFHTLQHTRSVQTLLGATTHNVKSIKAIVYASFRSSRASGC